jgi:outer membrane lipoprotein-sorting protein
MGSNDGDGPAMSRGNNHHRTNHGTSHWIRDRGPKRAVERPWLRWIPAVAVPSVIAAGVLAGTIPARAGDPLPAKTPAEVIALLASHKTPAFSGTIEQASELGLPELPATPPTSGAASADGVASLMEFLTGEHTARVFMDGATKVRIQVVDRLAERDIIRHDSDVWFYSSKDNSAAHLTLPSRAHDLPLADPSPAGPSPVDPSQVPRTPQELAEKFLAVADSTTAVSVGPEVETAGRRAYTLLLEPRTDSTLVGKIAVAVDSQTGIPLSVQVTARGAAQPAFSAGFTSLSLEAPDQSLFNFAPPPGSTVKELKVGHPAEGEPGTGFPETPGTYITPDRMAENIHHSSRHYLSGSGWETVVKVPAESGAGSRLTALLARNPLLAQAAVAVPGGRLVSSALFNVLLTDDGRIFAGMVPPERLQAAAMAP